MSEVLVALCFVLGLFVGSALNLVICRVPRGEPMWAGTRHWPGCGHPIRVRMSIPILSWLALGGRCRECADPIPVRHPVVEGLTAVLFALMAWRFGAAWELPAYLYFVAIGVALSSIDLRFKRLPDRITIPSYPVWALLLLLPAAIDARWSDYLRVGLGGLALFGFYLVVLLVNPTGIGGGDVKLAGLLGMAMGWLGWGVLVAGGFLGQILAAVCVIALIATKRIGVRTKIPLGPFLIAGAVLAVLLTPLFTPWNAVAAQSHQAAATSRPCRFPDGNMQVKLSAWRSVKQSANASVAYSRGVPWSGAGRDP